MNKKYVSFDYSQIEDYLHKFEELRPLVEQVINNVLNEWGIIFLNKVTDNIIECKSVVTSNMIASFTFGDTNSIWDVYKRQGLFQDTGKAAIRVISLSMIRPLRAE